MSDIGADLQRAFDEGYEKGKADAWEIAQKVFNSTVTFYEAEDVAKQMTDCSKCETYWNCQGQCDEIPQIARADRPQGKWIEHKNAEEICGTLISNYECSLCHEWQTLISNFCPSCGAKMKGACDEAN